MTMTGNDTTTYTTDDKEVVSSMEDSCAQKQPGRTVVIITITSFPKLIVKVDI